MFELQKLTIATDKPKLETIDCQESKGVRTHNHPTQDHLTLRYKPNPSNAS